MNKNVLSERLLVQQKPDQRYHDKINLKFDYEVNNYSLDEKDPKQTFLLNKNNEKQTFLDSERFHDEIVEKFYRCKEISFAKKNWLKSIISKQKIRFRNNKFDLDLM
jgi:hypothetical protein